MAAKKETKKSLVEKVEKYLKEYRHVFILRLGNANTSFLNKVRKQLWEDRLLLGKQKVLAKGLEQHLPRVSKEKKEELSARLKGDVCLFFSNKTAEELRDGMEGLSAEAYPLPGDVSSVDAVIPCGQVLRGETPLSVQEEPRLREKGVASVVRDGAVFVEKEHRVCSQGDSLTAKQTQLLRMLGLKTETMKTSLVAFCDGESVFTMD
ncbi:MAG: mRNA turnover and ribosome assembly protein Mrt4 [Amphiamblys sp. WSBS2006]|nr:MAG: mRNA turnover and ribosome assembly protein Mrt4 [Amphiamblys sp. WSBS2006]